MADVASDGAVEARSMGTSGINSLSGQQAGPHPAPDKLFDDMDDTEDTEGIPVSNITNEDAHSLIEPSLSHVASRLKSPQTPALEKAAIMEELDGGGLFDSEVESPPVEVESPSEENLGLDLPTHVKLSAGETDAPLPKSIGGLSLGELPRPNLGNLGPNLWYEEIPLSNRHCMEFLIPHALVLFLAVPRL
jgi:hypothetical protein